MTTTQTSGRSGIKTFFIVFFAVLLAIVAGAWAIKTYLFPERFEPVELSQKEEQNLNGKLRALGYQGNAFAQSDANTTDSQPKTRYGSANTSDADDRSDSSGRLKPEAYSEDNAKREVFFNEKELNALIAKSPQWAEKFAIDLSNDLASAQLLMPLPQDFPIMPGQTLRISAGVEASFSNGRPVIALRGVSLWGVPVPNAWLGNLKNVDLVEQFGAQDGFWKSFADGVETIRVEDGQLYVKLKE